MITIAISKEQYKQILDNAKKYYEQTGKILPRRSYVKITSPEVENESFN